MAQQARAFSSKPDKASSVPRLGRAWWKEKADSLRLSPDLDM